MNLSQEHINEYLADLQARGFERCSVERYRYVLASLLEHCKTNCENSHECRREDIINFKIHLLSRFKSVTVNFYLAVIREFFRYFEKRGLGEDVTKGIENMKLARVMPSFVEIEELYKLFEMTDNDRSLVVFQSAGSSMINTRDVAIFELVIGTGIKAKLLCEIKRTEINIELGELYVSWGGHAKGMYRVIPIPRQTVNAIRLYLEFREKIFIDSPYLFIYRTGVKFHPRCVNRVCSKFLNHTTSKNKGPQTLRNSYVNLLMEGGANCQSIKHLAGYHSIQRTLEKLEMLSAAKLEQQGGPKKVFPES